MMLPALNELLGKLPVLTNLQHAAKQSEQRPSRRLQVVILATANARLALRSRV